MSTIWQGGRRLRAVDDLFERYGTVRRRDCTSARPQFRSFLLRAFFYVLVGFRLLHSRRLTVWLPIAIAAATGLILAAFGVHVAGGGLYKMRPLRARLLRAAVWACIAAVLWRAAAGIRN